MTRELLGESKPVSNISDIVRSKMRAVVQIGLVAALAATIAPLAAFAQDRNSSAVVASADAGSTPSAKSIRIANRKLAKSVRTTMAKAKGIDMTQLFVYAKGGVVTLSGSVPKSDQVVRAGEIAGSVPGVSSVNNRLSVYAIER
ncbi:BON domain-containing protein [Paraburkholderia elongata]|uniref:BON domain-containing protein n=1 Tax=Paraburkholderia elongata TaxID=2675747 RepID=UPI001557F4B7|nr:BON domain-containing protein [Paraburkholderia elongata]